MSGHIPERTCIACGARGRQADFLRVAARDGGTPVIDQLADAKKGREPGRGAYLCRRLDCVEAALKRRALQRALKLKNSVPINFGDEVRRAVENYKAEA